MLLSFSITVCAQTPVYQSSVVNNATPTRLEMTYNLTLANIISAASSFNVLVNSGSTPVTAVAISDKKVLLFLMNPVKNGDVISVSYTRPSINPVQSTTNVLAASLASQNVTNNVIAVTPFLYDNTGTAYYVKGVGFQIWMGGNLATTNYNDGTSIPNVTDQATWRALTTPAWCWYNNSDVNREMGYGALYNWYTINTGKLCPTGWHVPSTGEWVKLVTFLGDSLTAGGKLKEAGTAHWASPNINATNETGFSALPGGLRDNTGGFDDIGITGLWWSTTVNHSYTNVSWNRIMHSDNAYAYINASVWPYGCSVRCLQNVQPIAEISGTTSICINAAQPNITFTGITGTAPFTFTYSINSGSNQTVTTISGNSVTVSVPTGIAGTYTYSLVSVQDAYSTIAQTGSATVIVNPLPTANAGAALIVICQGGTSAALGGSVGGSATGGTWSTPVGGTFSPNATTLNATWTPPGTYSGTATLTLTTTGGSCGVASASKTQIVTANNAISLSSAAGTNAQTTCINTAITPITYTTTGATGASVSNLPTGVSGVWSGNVVTISGTPTVAGAARTYTVTLTGGCGVVTSTGTITVTAQPTATISYTGFPWCSAAGVQNVTLIGTTGGTYSAAPAGLTINSTTGAINPITSTAGTYTETYTIAALGGCGVVTATTSVTITALPVATFSFSASPYCNNAANPLPTFTGGGVAGTFSSTAGLVFVNTATGEVNLSASTPGTYTVTNTIAAAGGCGLVTTTAPISITALPVATFSYPGTPYCSNVTNPLPTFSGGGVAGTFSSTAGLVFVNTATGQINLSASTPGIYTVTNTIAAAGGCGVVTATAPVTINASPVPTITGPASICSGMTGTVYTTESGMTGYTWAVTPSGSITAGEGTNTITVTWHSNPSESVSVNYTNANGCTAASPKTYNVIVNPLPTVTTHNPAAVCSPATVDLTTAAVTSGSTAELIFTYWTDALATVSYPTPEAAGSGTYYIKGTSPATGCYDIKPVTVTVNPLPTATISGTTSVCLNGASPNITFTGANGTAPYTFTYAINGSGNQTVTTTSGNSVTVGAPTGTAGTFTYALVSVSDASSTACSQAQSGSATVTVTSTNTIALTSAVGTDAQTKCINTAITNITYSTTGATGATFAGLPTGVTGAWAGNVVTISGSPSVSAGSPYSYTVTLTGGCGTVTSSGTITVTPYNTITL